MTGLLLACAIMRPGPIVASRHAAPAEPARYRMEIRIEPALRRLSVTGTVRLPATEVARDTIHLALYSGATAVLFGLQVDDVTHPLRVSHDSGDGDRHWMLVPAAPIPAHQPVDIRFAYRIDSAAAPQLRADSVTTFAGSSGEIWYPRQAYDSTGTGAITFHVPPGNVVVATGEVRRLPRSGDGETFVAEIRRPLLFGFAAAPFVVYASEGPVPVRFYSLRSRGDGPTIARRARQTLDVLRDLFGPLPDPGYSIVEVDLGGQLAGTSEPGYLLADPTQLARGFALTFFGHEISHAWWGNLVRTRPGTPGRMMMSEGLAQYGMYRALEAIEGTAAARRLRAGDYPGTRLANSPAEYFAMSAAGLELPLTAAVPSGQDQVLRMHRMANSRGFLLLDMLAREIGPARLATGLRRFVADHAGEATSWADLALALEREARAPLGWFFTQWFDRDGAPTIDLAWHRTGDRVIGRVSQSGSAYRVHVDIAAYCGDRRLHRLVELREPVTHFTWQTSCRPDSLALDPDHLLLRWTPELRARMTALAPYTRANWVRRFGDGDTAIRMFTTILERLPEPDTLGLEFLAELGRGRAELDAGAAGAAAVHLGSAIAAPVREPDLLPTAYLELARAARRTGDRERSIRLLRAAISADLRLEQSTGVAAVAERALATGDAP